MIPKPWHKLGISKQHYLKARPWKAAGMAREKYEQVIMAVPQDAIDELRREKEADVLLEELFGGKNLIADEPEDG